MALSRYSVLPQQQVINTYVAPDLRYLAAAGQARQQAYDEGLAFNQAIEDKYAKVQTRDVDIARKNELVNQYTQEAQKIIEDNDGDVGRALPTLRKHANTYAGNPFWNHAENALKQYTDMQEANKRITEKGGSALVFNDDAAKKAVYNPDGTYNTPSYELQTALDYTEPKQKLMDDIAKDTRLTGLSHASIAGMLQSGKFTGVTGKKVEAVAHQMLLPYLGTDAGRQEVRVLQKAGYTDSQIQKRLLSSLVGVGSKQVGMQADDSYVQDPLALFQLKMSLKAQEAAKNLELSEAETGATLNPLAAPKLNLDKDGKPYVDVKDPNAATGQYWNMTAPIEDKSISKAQGTKMLDDLRSNYKRLHPNEAIPNDKSLAELYNNSVENSRLTTIKAKDFTPKASEIASKTMLGVNYKKGDISGLQGRQIVMLGTKGEVASQPITLEKALEAMGVKPDEKHKITSAQVTGPLGHNPLIPGGYHVTITAGGKPYELAISGPKQRQDFVSQYQPLINTAYTGQSARVKMGSITFKSIAAPNGKGFDTQVRSYEEVGGKLIPMREREADGKTIKKDKQGRTVYAPNQSLQHFTDTQEEVFKQAYGDLFNVSGATGKELDDDPDL